MTPYEKNLDAALSPETPPKPDELKAALLAVYAKFELFNGTVHQKAGLHLHLDGLLASLMTRTMPTQMIKTDRVTVEHSGSVDASGSGIHADKRLAHITLRQRAEEDRATSKAALAGRSTRPNGCGRPSRSFAPGSIWAVTSGLPPASPARSRPLPPRQSTWPNRPSFRLSGTGRTIRKISSFTAASCYG